MSTREESGEIFQQIEAPTVSGVARASFEIDKPGKVQISVVSEPAVNSAVLLQFDFDASNEVAVLTVVAPTPSATPTAPILPTATAIIPENDLVTPLRQINPAIAARTERAVLWAMSLHPDERPSTIDDFRQSLLGDREIPLLPIPGRRERPQPVLDYLSNPPEATLAWGATVLLLLSLLATLVR